LVSKGTLRMYNEELDEKIEFFKKKENDLSENELNYKIG
jgi:hypothetical protein